jgi:hypothetical protein
MIIDLRVIEGAMGNATTRRKEEIIEKMVTDSLMTIAQMTIAQMTIAQMTIAILIRETIIGQRREVREMTRISPGAVKIEEDILIPGEDTMIADKVSQVRTTAHKATIEGEASIIRINIIMRIRMILMKVLTIFYVRLLARKESLNQACSLER